MKKSLLSLLVLVLALSMTFGSQASAASYEVTLKGYETVKSTTSVYTPGNLNIKVELNWGYAVYWKVKDSSGNIMSQGRLDNVSPDVNYSIKVPAGNYRLYLEPQKVEKDNDFVGYLSPY